MREFKSKILLFGEYALMKGARALSIPFVGFSGKLSFEKGPLVVEESNRLLRKFLHYQQENQTSQQLHFPLNLDVFQQEIYQGIWFDSTIPLQYGVGSSGALVAALFDRYSSLSTAQGDGSNLPVYQLKADFSILESYFHGTSSGFDPLVSFLDRPVLLGNSGKVEIVPPVGRPQIKMFLADTKVRGATAPLVGYFIRKAALPGFQKKLVNRLIPANDRCIEYFLKDDPDLFFPELQKLVDFQLCYMKRMFPSGFQKIIKESSTDGLFIKLLGSGGGGFLLGFASNEKSIRSFSEKHQIEVTLI